MANITATCNIETLKADACSSKFLCLPPNIQRAVLLQLLCNIAAGGGISGVTGVYSGDYSGVAPAITPSGTGAVSRDSVTGQVWWWNPDSSTWEP
jgi:hypothetical protein